MLVNEISPASFLRGRVLLKLSKEAIGLLHRCRLQTGDLLVEIATRLSDVLAVVLKEHTAKILDDVIELVHVVDVLLRRAWLASNSLE